MRMNKKYFVRGKNKPVIEKEIEFEGEKGQNINIKKDNVLKFHKMINLQPNYSKRKILEVSSKSNSEIGQKCSAFNLVMGDYSFESIFQSSKVFDGNIRFSEVLTMKPNAAKKYVAMNRKGRDLIRFEYNDVIYPNVPRTFFYDYMYCKCIDETLNESEKEELVHYTVFTDIEFGRGAFNCQAKSLCIYSYLYKHGLLGVLSDPEEFKKLVY